MKIDLFCKRILTNIKQHVRQKQHRYWLRHNGAFYGIRISIKYLQLFPSHDKKGTFTTGTLLLPTPPNKILHMKKQTL